MFTLTHRLQVGSKKKRGDEPIINRKDISAKRIINTIISPVLMLSILFYFIPVLSDSTLMDNKIIFDWNILLYLTLFVLGLVILLDATRWFDLSGHLKNKLIIFIPGSAVLLLLFSFTVKGYYQTRMFILLNTVCIASFILARGLLLVFARKRTYNPKSIFIFSNSEFVQMLKRHLEKEGISIELTGYFDGSYINWGSDGEHQSWNGNINELLRDVKQKGATEILLAHQSLTYKNLTDLMLSEDSHDISIKMTRSLYKKIVGRTPWKGIDPFGFVDLRRTEDIEETYVYAKRLFDLTFSIIVFLWILPVFIITAIAIKLTSRGPVFYKHIRAGKHGKPFTIYKFRSMVTNADVLLKKYVDLDRLNEPVYKLKHDPRLTAIGRFLRTTSIDELPQIFNVIRNDISWIGIRPEDIEIVRRYDSYFRKRLLAKPGITGLQQVNCRGVHSLKKRMKYDLDYWQKQNFWFDMKIIFLTIAVVISKKGAW